MRYLIFLTLILLASCSKPIEKPEKLLSENEMSQLIADFALADQMSVVTAESNLEMETRYILKTHNIKAKEFRDSYTYYTGINKLDEIFTESQRIVTDKDPKAVDYIKKKLENNPGLAPVGR